jgi:two-component system cell cycle sensor histidine kinase/response regulator CckA
VISFESARPVVPGRAEPFSGGLPVGARDNVPGHLQPELLTRLLDAVPDVIFRFRFHPNPCFEFVSRAVARLTGYQPEELYADPSLGELVVHHDDRWMQRRLLENPAELNRPLVQRWLHRDGSVVWVETRYAPVMDGEGRIVAVDGVVRDITESRRAGEELARLSAAIEQAAEVVMITDSGGTLLYVNPAFERVTGYSRAEVLGRNPRILRSGLQDEAFYRRMWATLTAGDVFSATIVNRRKDGTHYTAEAVVSPVRSADGTLVNYVGLQRDVTRERELDEALRQSQKVEAIGLLTGGIAHDFNNLLTVILANATLVNAELPHEHVALRTYLSELETAARRGSSMVRRLLAFGRRERISLAELNLDEFIAEYAPTLRRVLPETIGVTVGRASVPLVMADASAVEQMVLNLATNARDAMPSGGRLSLASSTASIDAEDAMIFKGLREAGEHVVLSVADNGSGMDRGTLEKCFEPFFTTKPKGAGTGLGLPMVFGLMRQHGGFAQLYSEPGQGTVVKLHFPVAPAGRGPVRPDEVMPAVRSGTGETLLLVEDDLLLRRAAHRVLERYGYRVIPAEDGVEALARFEEHRSDIRMVLSDVVMPRLGGEDLANELRSRDPAIPVLLMSGYSSPADGPDAVGVRRLSKPWTGEDLARAVRSALDASAPDQTL